MLFGRFAELHYLNKFILQKFWGFEINLVQL